MYDDASRGFLVERQTKTIVIPMTNHNTHTYNRPFAIVDHVKKSLSRHENSSLLENVVSRD